MSRLLPFLTVCLLLAAPVVAAICPSCVSGPCSESGMTRMEKKLDEPRPAGVEMPPCHAGMMAKADSRAPMEHASTASPTSMTEDCHDPVTGIDASCCVASAQGKAELPTSQSLRSLDHSALDSATHLEVTVTARDRALAASPAPPPRPPSEALFTLHAAFLI